MATYEVIRKLGEGSHGIVYEAEQIELKRRVAMKRLRPEMRGRSRVVERFAREAQVCGSLNHPNVVTVHDSGVDELGPFIAFELLVGETLLELGRREAPLPAEQVVDIVDGTLLGLGSAHACGIVHRDIKPANVFLCDRPDGSTTVKLLDFGVSKRPTRESLTGLTNPGDVIGSFSFMAHEQLFQEHVDGRADLYSVGVCMYMLLSGVKPFDAATVQDLLLQLKQRPTPLTQRVPSLSPALSATVQRALEREPKDRFASAEEMRAAVLACRDTKSQSWGHATLSDITIRERAADRSHAPAPFDAPTATADSGRDDGVTEPLRLAANRHTRLAAPSEAETMPRAVSSRLIALSVEAIARDPSLAAHPPMEALEQTARMAAPVLPASPGVSGTSEHASAREPSLQRSLATRDVAITPTGALPNVTPRPPPSGRLLSPPPSAPSVIVESSVSSSQSPLPKVALHLPNTSDPRGAETAPALRLAQLRRDDLELEGALGNHRRADRTRAVVFGLLGFVAVLSLAVAVYLYGR